MKVYDKRLASPYLIWMALFTVIPLLIVCYYAPHRQRRPFHSGQPGLGQRVRFGLCPQLAAGSHRHRGLSGHRLPGGVFPVPAAVVNKQRIMQMLVMLPMWMNFLLRTYAWMGPAEHQRPPSTPCWGLFGLGPFNMLNTAGAVVLGMVYNYVPYMILPLYTSMVKIDQSIIEARPGPGGPTHHQDPVPGPDPHERAGHLHRHHQWCLSRRCPLLSSAGCWAAAPTC